MISKKKPQPFSSSTGVYSLLKSIEQLIVYENTFFRNIFFNSQQGENTLRNGMIYKKNQPFSYYTGVYSLLKSIEQLIVYENTFFRNIFL